MNRAAQAAFSVFIGVMVVISGFAGFLSVGVAPVAAGGTVVDDFEDGDAAEWTWVQRTTTDAYEGSYAFDLQKSDASATKLLFSDKSGISDGDYGTMSNWMKVEAYPDSKAALNYQLGPDAIVFINPDGTLRLYNSGSTQYNTSYTMPKGTYKEIRFTGVYDGDGNFTLNVYDQAGNKEFSAEGVLQSAGSTTTGVRVGGADPPSVKFDNIQVWESNVKSYTVSGTVEDNAGNALTNASVEATDSSGTVVDSATTDSAGAYSISLPDGDYTITADKSQYETGSQSVSVTSDTSGVDFSLVPEDSTIVGHVEDQDGNPQGFAEVEAHNEDTATVAATTKTDGTGNFSFALGSGNYTLTVSKGHYAGAEKQAVYTDGTTPATDSGTFVITRHGPYEDGLYEDMKPVMEGNLTTADLDMHCEPDRSDAIHVAFAQTLFDSSEQQCEATSAGTTQIDMVESAASMNQTEQELLVVMSNRLEDTRGIAYTEGKIAAAEALNRGANQSVAREEARQAIEEAYAVMWRNTLSRWGTSATQADYVHETMVNNSEGDWIYVTDANGDGGFGNKQTMTVTLPNGESEAFVSYSDADGNVISPVPANSSSSAGPTVRGDKVTVYGPGKNASTTFANSETYGSLFDSMQSQEDQVKGNVGQLVSSLYDNYNQDEINTSDLLSPRELGEKASTSYNSTGFYSYAAAEMASLGYGGDTQHAQTVEISTSTGTENVTGTVFYTGDDKPGLSTGETVDPTNYNGSYMVATNDGIREVNDPFTVESQTNLSSGEEVASTSFERSISDYGTADASNFSRTVGDLKDTRKEYQKMENFAVGGGGGAGNGLGIGIPDFVGAIAAGIGVSREVATAGAVAAGGLGAWALLS